MEDLRGQSLPETPFPGGRDAAFRVFVEPEVHAGVWRHAGENVAVEICGVLVGRWARDAAGPYAHISAYIRGVSTLAAGPKKASQIRLSNALARVLANELGTHVPRLKGNLVTDEQKVAGGLRTANADVSESHYLDGLRLAVELKPINLAVGRAIWNRFGDVRGDSRYNRPCFGLSLSWVRKNRHGLTRLCHPKSDSSRTLRPTCRGSHGTRG